MEQPPIKIGTQLRPSARLTIAPQIEPWFAVAWFRRHVAAQAVAEAERLEALVEIAIEDQYAAEANFAVDQEMDVVALSATDQQEIQNLEAQAASLLIHASPLNQIRRIKFNAPEPSASTTALAEIARLEREVVLNIDGPTLHDETARLEYGYNAIHESEVSSRDSWYAALQDAKRRAQQERREKPGRVQKLREAVAEDLRQQAINIKRQTEEEELTVREESERVAFENKQKAYALRERARMLRDKVEASERVRQRGLKRATIIEKLRHSAGKKTRTEQWDAALEQARLLRLAVDCIERHDEGVDKDSVEVSRFALEHHTFIVGVPGFGKTRLITHLLKEQMRAGCSVIYIDPKPDATRVLLSAAIDAQVRPKNIIIIDPAGGVPVPGWNPFLHENLSPDVIASGLKDFIQSMSTSWGPFMDELMDCALTIVAHHRLSLRECLALIEKPAYRRALLSRQPVSGGSLEYDEAVEYFHDRFERHESSIESVTVRLCGACSTSLCFGPYCVLMKTPWILPRFGMSKKLSLRILIRCF